MGFVEGTWCFLVSLLHYPLPSYLQVSLSFNETLFFLFEIIDFMI
jgi:hypothetical protein